MRNLRMGLSMYLVMTAQRPYQEEECDHHMVELEVKIMPPMKSKLDPARSRLHTKWGPARRCGMRDIGHDALVGGARCNEEHTDQRLSRVQPVKMIC